MAIKTKIKHLEILIFSVFYHDIIYNPQNNDNELKSAEFMFKSISNISFPIPRTKKCFKQIIATQSHISDNSDTNFLLDADLSIFGSSPEKYKIYSTQIRQEYSFFSENKYKNGRIEVLQYFQKMKPSLRDFIANE